jgi:hypothetical protein
LAAVNAVWPTLPAAIRAGILAMVNAAGVVHASSIHRTEE